jgi:putative transposase
MSRIARVSVEGVPYHVTQRGNGRQSPFFSESDYHLYLDLIRANAERFRLQIWAYCLMPNHVHFVVVPDGPAAMTKTFGRTHADYARHFNLRQGVAGTFGRRASSPALWIAHTSGSRWRILNAIRSAQALSSRLIRMPGPVRKRTPAGRSDADGQPR